MTNEKLSKSGVNEIKHQTKNNLMLRSKIGLKPELELELFYLKQSSLMMHGCMVIVLLKRTKSTMKI